MKLSYTLLFLLAITFSSFAFQTSNTIATINNEPISSAEFLYAYHKNRKDGGANQYDSLQKYLDQYIDFKLKVLAAHNAGIDTTQAFIDEYNGYISQVQKPYMQNPNTEEDLILEAYNRLKEEVHAAHILIKFKNEADPTDTLRAYQKIDSLRKTVLSGVPFEEVARKNSEDGSARNGGDLGWFSGLTMVYPFENGAYETPVGEVSGIIRSQFGYHIIKVLDRRPTRGKVKTSHIFLTKNGRSVENGNQLMKTIYDSLQNGGDWKELVKKYSEDSRTKLNSGGLPLAGTGELPDEYLDIAHSLKNEGDISKPTETSYGWHIVKLDMKQEMPSLETLRDNISERVRRSGRNQIDLDELVKKLKTENGFKQDFQQLKNVIEKIEKVGLPNVDVENQAKQEIFSIGEKSYSYGQFFSSLGNANQFSASTLWNRYKVFEREQLMEYENQLASKKYPEFGFLLNEYKEGLMLFTIMENQIWNKAAEDSTGLKVFFQNHQKDYPAPERAQVWVIESTNADVLKDILTNVSWQKGENLPDVIESKIDGELFDELKIAKRTFLREDFPNFAQNWEEKVLIGDTTENRIYAIDEIIAAGNYRLDEVKGLVISDYQDYLDKAWVAQLRKENKIKINKKELKQLASHENR